MWNNRSITASKLQQTNLQTVDHDPQIVDGPHADVVHAQPGVVVDISISVDLIEFVVEE